MPAFRPQEFASLPCRLRNLRISALLPFSRRFVTKDSHISHTRFIPSH